MSMSSWVSGATGTVSGISYTVTTNGPTLGFGAVDVSGQTGTNGPDDSGLRNTETPKYKPTPTVFFKLMKKRYTKMQEQVLRVRMERLAVLVENTRITQQVALNEAFIKEMAVVVQQQAIFACGMHHYLNKSTIDKYINKIKLDGKRIVKFSTLEKFPRTIPRDVTKKLQACRDRELFDEYHILYTDYTDTEIKTNTEKIIDKDPILFGASSLAPDLLYPIADWIDEYCDLTIDKLIDVVKLEELGEVGRIDLSRSYLQEIVKQAQESVDRLNNTRPSNYKQLAVDQAKQTALSQMRNWNWKKLLFWRKK